MGGQAGGSDQWEEGEVPSIRRAGHCGISLVRHWAGAGMEPQGRDGQEQEAGARGQEEGGRGQEKEPAKEAEKVRGMADN